MEALDLLARRLFHKTAKQFRTRTLKSSICRKEQKRGLKNIEIWVQFNTFTTFVFRVPTFFPINKLVWGVFLSNEHFLKHKYIKTI